MNKNIYTYIEQFVPYSTNSSRYAGLLLLVFALESEAKIVQLLLYGYRLGSLRFSQFSGC